MRQDLGFLSKVVTEKLTRAFIAKSDKNARHPLACCEEVIRIGRRRRYDPDRVTTAVRIPAEIHQKLQEEAEARDVSLNYLLVRGAELVLQRLTPLATTEAELEWEAS